jgi:DNA adenine methylase
LNIIKSAIPYLGNKHSVFNKIEDKLPDNIKTFRDIFCGSGVVSLNVLADKYVMSDISHETIELHERISNIEFCKYVMSHSSKFEHSKEGYLNLREYYNRTRQTSDLLLLLYRSFSNQMRFNKRGDFNTPYGNRNTIGWDKLVHHSQFLSSNDVQLNNCSFERSLGHAQADDFVFLDPPYFNSVATYNEGWNDSHEEDLYDAVSKLPCKWMMTNTLSNRGIDNDRLIKFSEDYNVYPIDSTFNYDKFRKTEHVKLEVIITNY